MHAISLLLSCSPLLLLVSTPLSSFSHHYSLFLSMSPILSSSPLLTSSPLHSLSLHLSNDEAYGHIATKEVHRLQGRGLQRLSTVASTTLLRIGAAATYRCSTTAQHGGILTGHHTIMDQSSAVLRLSMPIHSLCSPHSLLYLRLSCCILPELGSQFRLLRIVYLRHYSYLYFHAESLFFVLCLYLLPQISHFVFTNTWLPAASSFRKWIHTLLRP